MDPPVHVSLSLLQLKPLPEDALRIGVIEDESLALFVEARPRGFLGAVSAGAEHLEEP